MDSYDVQFKDIVEVATAHDQNKDNCAGLPLCVACRAVALLMCDLNPLHAELLISKQPEGKILRVEEISFVDGRWRP